MAPSTSGRGAVSDPIASTAIARMVYKTISNDHPSRGDQVLNILWPLRPVLSPAWLPAGCSGRNAGTPGGVISIHDSWGTQKETAASGGHGRAAGCAVPLNVAVLDLPSFHFLHTSSCLAAVPLLQGSIDLRMGS